MQKLSLSLLLVLATVYAVAASDCSFSFYRNAKGNFARLELGHNYLSAIQVNNNSSWVAYVLHGDNLTVTDQTGVSRVEKFSDIPLDERTFISDLLHQDISGYKVSSYAGGLEIKCAGGLKFKTREEKDYSVSLKSDGWYASLCANIDAKYNHVFFLSNSAAILLDAECRVPKYRLFKDLDPDIQKVLNDIIRSKWN